MATVVYNALSDSEIKESCERCGLTTLLCEQGFDATLDDTREMNPDLDEHELHVATLVRMLDENLDFGVLAEDDDELERDDHCERMAVRADISELVADRWAAGMYSGQGVPEIELANDDARALAEGNYQ